jgi:hypothetical protein
MDRDCAAEDRLDRDASEPGRAIIALNSSIAGKRRIGLHEVAIAFLVAGTCLPILGTTS